MKTLSAVLLVAGVFLLSSCASHAPTSTVKRLKDLQVAELQQIKGMIPPPQAQQTQVRREMTPDEKVLFENIVYKASRLDYEGLRLANEILDVPWEKRADPTLEIFLTMVKNEGFPDYLKEIVLSHKELRKIPLKESSLVRIKSETAPGVQVIYLKIPAQYIQEGERVSIFDWIPDLSLWLKFVNLKALKLGKLQEPQAQSAFLKLFWLGNKVANPGFEKALREGKPRFNWRAMPNPKMFGNGMIIPIATEELMK